MRSRFVHVGILAHTALVASPIVLQSTAFATVPSGVAVQGYLYGYPILVMEETRIQGICGPDVSVNQLEHVSEPPDDTFRTIVRPNVDTLYSSAFLDVSEGPMVLEMPPTEGRYQLIALFDAWTNNFEDVSTLTSGHDGGTFVIAHEDWVGEVPDAARRFDSPTPWVWLLVRTEFLGLDDVPAVNAIQDAMTLAPLGGQLAPPVHVECPAEAPPDAVASSSGVDFFSRLDRLIDEQGAPPNDEEMLQKLKSIEVGPYATGSVEDLPFIERVGLGIGVDLAQLALDVLAETPSTGWSPSPALQIGEYGQRYFVRAAVARTGFGANRNELAIYQSTNTDAQGSRLNGEDVYTITFGPGATPPVEAFWSLTVYDSNLYLANNPIDRFALGSNSGLVAADDGSIVVTLSHEPPEDGPLANWLPVPDEPFELMLRMYGPTPAILEEVWTAPYPELVDTSVCE